MLVSPILPTKTSIHLNTIVVSLEFYFFNVGLIGLILLVNEFKLYHCTVHSMIIMHLRITIEWNPQMKSNITWLLYSSLFSSFSMSIIGPSLQWNQLSSSFCSFSALLAKVWPLKTSFPFIHNSSLWHLLWLRPRTADWYTIIYSHITTRDELCILFLETRYMLISDAYGSPLLLRTIDVVEQDNTTERLLAYGVASKYAFKNCDHF